MTTNRDVGTGFGGGGPGPVIPGYRAFSPIAQGGFSIVYTAYQDRLDRTVAVKVIGSDLRDAAAARRFTRECKLAGKLTGHPNIITVFEAGSTADRRPFIAMQYLPGGSVADRLAREGPLGVADTLRIGALIADALQAAHEAKILHRDVKPGNILLSERGEPVLSDFGIASHGLGSEISASRDVFTPSFAAPEVLQGADPSVASDLYGLGGTLFAMLTGEPPFGQRAGDNSATMMLRVLSEDVRPVGRPDVGENVEYALRTLLSRDPSFRPRTAAEVANELRRLYALHGHTARRTPDAPLGAPPPFVPDVPAVPAVPVSPVDPTRTEGQPDASIPPIPPIPPATPPPRLPRPAAWPEWTGTPQQAAFPHPPPAAPPLPPSRTAYPAHPASAHPAHPDYPAYSAAAHPAPVHPAAAYPAHPAAGDSPVSGPDAAGPDAGRSAWRRRTVTAGVTAVGLILAVLVAATVIRPDEGDGMTLSPDAGTSATTQPASFTAADLAAARPQALVALDADAVITLTWTNGSVADSLVLQVIDTAGPVPFIELPPGATVHEVPVDPDMRYCFRVGAVLGVDPAEGVVASWSDYACIRGAVAPG